MNELPVQDQALLNDLLDSRLEADVATALHARIRQEPALAEAWRELQQLRDWGRSYAETTAALQPPEVLAERIRAATCGDAESAQLVEDAPSGEASTGQDLRRGRLLRMLAVSYAAAALLVVGITVGWVLNGPGDATHPDDATIDTAGADKTAGDKTSADKTAPDQHGAVRRAPGPTKATRGVWEEEQDARDVATLEVQGDSASAGRADAKDELLAEAERERDAALARLREEEMRPRAGGRSAPSPAAGGGKVGHFAPADSVRPGLRKARDAEEGRPQRESSPKGGSRKGKAKDLGEAAPLPGADSLGAEPRREPEAGADDAVGAGARDRRPAPKSFAGSSPEPESIGVGGGLAAKPLKTDPAAAAREGDGKSSPASPARRFRLRLAAARQAQEQLFVLEVGDAQAGLQAARELLDQGISTEKARGEAADKQAPGTRLYRAAALDLEAVNGRLPKKRSGPGTNETARSVGPQYVGSVGRQLDQAAFQRLLQRASPVASRPADAPLPQPGGPAAPPPPAAPGASEPDPRTPSARTPGAPEAAPGAPTGQPTAVRILVLVRR